MTIECDYISVTNLSPNGPLPSKWALYYNLKLQVHFTNHDMYINTVVTKFNKDGTRMGSLRHTVRVVAITFLFALACTTSDHFFIQNSVPPVVLFICGC